MSEIDAAPIPAIPAGQFLGPPAPAAPLAPTSPPAQPSKSREVEIQAERAALSKQIETERNTPKRMALLERKLALDREELGAENKVHTVIGRDPAAPPEPEVSTGRAWQPTVQPRGDMPFDDEKLNDLDVRGRTAGFSVAERQGWANELARSTHRENMPDDARLAQTQRTLEQEWGPKAGARFQLQVDRAKMVAKAKLRPDELDDLERSGAWLDAWVWLELAKAWDKAHPRP